MTDLPPPADEPDAVEEPEPVEDESTPEQPVVQRAGTPLVEQPGEDGDEPAG